MPRRNSSSTDPVTLEIRTPWRSIGPRPSWSLRGNIGRTGAGNGGAAGDAVQAKGAVDRADLQLPGNALEAQVDIARQDESHGLAHLDGAAGLEPGRRQLADAEPAIAALHFGARAFQLLPGSRLAQDMDFGATAAAGLDRHRPGYARNAHRGAGVKGEAAVDPLAGGKIGPLLGICALDQPDRDQAGSQDER